MLNRNYGGTVAVVASIQRPEENAECQGKLRALRGRLAGDLGVLPRHVAASSAQYGAQDAPLGAGQVHFVIDTTCVR